MARATIAIIVVVVMLAGLWQPVSVAAQSGQICVTLVTGYGRGPVQVYIPAWVTRLEATVAWSGTQLRMFVDGAVWAVTMSGNYLSTPDRSPSGDWGGLREIKWRGVLLEYVHEWELRGCGTVPPTPTPTPIPTSTPVPWPTASILAPICETMQPVAVTGEYIISTAGTGVTARIYYDLGGSGDPGTRYEVIPYGRPGTVYDQEITIAVPVATLVRVLSGSGYGLPMVWVEVRVCTLPGMAHLAPTPLALRADDVQPVAVGAVYVGTSCYTIMPSVTLDVPIPGLDNLRWSWGGFGVCLAKYALDMRWGGIDIMGLVWPLLAFAGFWAVFRLFRRG